MNIEKFAAAKAVPSAAVTTARINSSRERVYAI